MYFKKRMYWYINLCNWTLEKNIHLKGFWRVISSSFQWRTVPGRTQSWGLSTVLTEAVDRPLGPVQGLWMAEHSIHYSSFTSSCKFWAATSGFLQASFLGEMSKREASATICNPHNWSTSQTCNRGDMPSPSTSILGYPHSQSLAILSGLLGGVV